MTGNTGDGSMANAQLSVGAATSPTNQWCFAGSAQDGSSTGLAPVRRNSRTAVAGAVAVGSASVLAEAQLKSLDADGFTLTWTAADSTARQVTYLALGGISLANAYAGSYNLPTATGAVAVTGLGFKPTGLLVLANPGSLTALPYVESGGLHYESGFAFNSSMGNGDASILFQNDAAGSASSYQAGGIVTSSISTSGVTSQATLQSFDSNGFTLSFSAVSGLATPEFYVAVQGPVFAAGSFNQATAIGNQTIGLSFQPAAVLFSSTDRASSSAVAPGAKLSLGVATSSTNQFALFVGANIGVPTAASQSIDSTEALDMMTPAGASPTTQAAFDFVSNNAGGFTINNTAVDATSRQVIYLAIGQPAAAAPTFSPAGGIYSTARTVSLSTTTSGASIRYTTDGSTPSDTAGTLYTGPITVSVTSIIKAVAYASGFANSTVSTTTYTIGSGPAAAPTFSPPAGTYAGAQSVTISTTTVGASIRYTTNGTTPSSTVGTLLGFGFPVTVSSNTTLKAIAYATGISNSPVSTAVYTIVPAASISSLSPTSGLVGAAVTITGSNFWGEPG
jgi:hypothetical protein